MNLQTLYEPLMPWLVTYEPTPSESGIIPSFLYRHASRQALVTRLRGRKMRSKPRLMDEFGAALQFFDGFGENWHALGECLRYLDEWLPAESYILVITDPTQVLCEDLEERRWLFRVLEEAGEWWSTAIVDNGRFNRSARAFHVVLECSLGTSAEVSAMWPGIGSLERSPAGS
jgi:hypothetical protein